MKIERVEHLSDCVQLRRTFLETNDFCRDYPMNLYFFERQNICSLEYLFSTRASTDRFCWFVLRTRAVESDMGNSPRRFYRVSLVRCEGEFLDTIFDCVNRVGRKLLRQFSHSVGLSCSEQKSNQDVRIRLSAKSCEKVGELFCLSRGKPDRPLTSVIWNQVVRKESAKSLNQSDCAAD